MTASPDAKHVEITVSNFGPIASGTIELRPMTVFVGPSNTGKSYFASLIYTLQRFFCSNLGPSDENPTLPREFWAESTRKTRARTGSFSQSDVTELVNWFAEAIPQFAALEKDASQSFLQLPKHVSNLVRSRIDDVVDFSRVLDSEFARCFGVEKTRDLRSLNRKDDTAIVFKGEFPFELGMSQSFSYEVNLRDEGISFASTIPAMMNLSVDRSFLEKHLKFHWLFDTAWTADDNLRVFGALKLLDSLADGFTSVIVSPLSLPTHYLPADRAGVMHAHQVVVRSLIASASRAALRPDSPLPVLSGVLGDFLDQLVALSNVSNIAHEDYDTIASKLEHSLLQGAVSAERSEQINYPSVAYRPQNWKRDLPLMNASSMVSELAPVVLYLRHVVLPGNLLIIEEPEAHLHPEMQAVFTRQLVAAVQSGVRILITTHSEWILEELANLVRLSELPPDQREGIEDPDISLSPDQLGTWFFEPNEEKGGSVVREISLDEESATFPAGFGLVTENLYNRWVEISTRIQEI